MAAERKKRFILLYVEVVCCDETFIVEENPEINPITAAAWQLFDARRFIFERKAQQLIYFVDDNVHCICVP